ncbi:MAG: CRP/FNR family transcriptional regulator, partial [Flavobacteriales bacterium]
MKNMIDQYYGQLFEPALLEEIVASATISTVSEGTVLMEVGSYVKNMPLLLSGAIKILREDKEGNELLLYFLEKGDTCAMTM